LALIVRYRWTYQAASKNLHSGISRLNTTTISMVGT
jgi:hypothetical protein